MTPYIVENHWYCSPFIHMIAAKVRVKAKTKDADVGKKAHLVRAFGRAGLILFQRPVPQPVRQNPPDAESTPTATI